MNHNRPRVGEGVLVLRVVGGQVEVSGSNPGKEKVWGPGGFTLAPPILSGYIHQKVVEQGDNRLGSCLSTTVPGYAGVAEQATREGDGSTASAYPHVGRLGLSRAPEIWPARFSRPSTLLGHQIQLAPKHIPGEEMRVSQKCLGKAPWLTTCSTHPDHPTLSGLPAGPRQVLFSAPNPRMGRPRSGPDPGKELSPAPCSPGPQHTSTLQQRAPAGVLELAAPDPGTRWGELS